jgi:hypothetical protein
MSAALRTVFVLSLHTITLQFVTGVMPWTTSAIPLIAFRESTRLDLAMKFSSELNPISVIWYRSTLSGTTMYVPKSGSLYPSMALVAKPLHGKAALVACFAMPTRMSTIRSRTHTETGSIVVRHDCYFRHFTPFPSLLNAEVENRRRKSSQWWWHVHRPPNGRWCHKRKPFTIEETIYNSATHGFSND